MNKVLRRSVCLILLLLLAPIALAADGPPRYRLNVGDAHAFDSTVQFKVRDRIIERAETYSAWVIGDNPDGSRQVVVQKKSTLKQPNGGAGKTSTDFGYADLSDDGTVNPQTQFGLSVYTLFPKLPPEPGASQWTGPGRTKDGVTTYTSNDTDAADGLTFGLTATGPLYQMQLTSYDATATFDQAKGVVTSMDSRYAQGFGSGVNAIAKTTYASVSKLSPNELAGLQQDARQVFDALRKQDALLDEVKYATPDDGKAKVGQAQAILDELKVDHPGFTDYVAQFRAALPAQAALATDIAMSRAALLDKAAPEWALDDLNGTPHKLTDYRGKTVVLEFWNRGCTICMASMPKLKQVIERYQDKPVVFVGMNTDEDVANAKFVVENMKLPHTNVRAAGVTNDYKLVFFPSLYIIDPEGVVREIHVGGSDTFVDDISQAIDRVIGK